MDINLDIKDLDGLAQKLADLKKNYFPAAVRNTLYQLALDMREQGGLIEQSADGSFEYKRSRTFMRSIVWAEYAKGNDVNKMRSGAGIGVKSNGKDRVSHRMEAQEHGGTLKRGYTPTKGARRGDMSNNVSGNSKHKNADYSDVDNDLVGMSGQNIMAKLSMTYKNKEYVRIRSRKRGKILIAQLTGSKTVYRTKFKGFTKRGKRRYSGAFVRMKYDMRFLYAYNEGKHVRVNPTHFVEKAGNIAIKNADEYFAKAAKEQLEKAFNKK